MGRSKSQPTKKRPRLDEVQVEAIALLQNAPQEQVERAAAEGVRVDVQQNWPHLIQRECDVDVENDNSNQCGEYCNQSHKDDKVTFVDAKTCSHHKNTTVVTAATPVVYKHVVSSVPSWAQGLGSSRKIDPKHFSTLHTLHQLIKTQSSSHWTSWSGNPSDPRQRAFGFLPGTLGYNATVRQKHLDISMPWRLNSYNDNADHDYQVTEERSRNERAMVVLERIPDSTQEAIDHVCQLFRLCLQKKIGKDCNDNSTNDCRPYLADFLQYRYLIAAQPNLHNGRALLPVHLDHPGKDGFGVIIITIAMTGSATILLQDVTDTKGLAMPLASGEAYMLAGMARNACVHGVLADVGSEHRESLNLRFGLHDCDGEAANGPNKDSALPVVPSNEVLQYWETTTG
jgi:hypothetical protein